MLVGLSVVTQNYQYLGGLTTSFLYQKNYFYRTVIVANFEQQDYLGFILFCKHTILLLFTTTMSAILNTKAKFGECKDSMQRHLFFAPASHLCNERN